MEKFKDGVSNAGLMTGNTIATPFRRWGELANAWRNIERQLLSWVKNIKEIQIQSVNAVADNFLNFSKVTGKRYQRLIKWWVNLVSAVTRRPFMLVWAQVAGTVNQWVLHPLKKLIIDTPVKLLKGIRNATRIFSTKKGFDFQSYDTHETKWDTRINQIREKRIGFFGTWWTSEKKEEEKKPEEKKPEEKKPEEKKPEVKKEEEKKEEKKIKETVQDEKPKKVSKAVEENPHEESNLYEKKIKENDDKFLDKELSDRGYSSGGSLIDESKKEEKGTSINEIKNQRTRATLEKERGEIESKKRKNQNKDQKIELKKEFGKLLENNFTEKWILTRAKKHNKGNTMEEVLRKLDKENVTFATFIDDEILAKKTPIQ